MECTRSRIDRQPFEARCADGVVLRGDFWNTDARPALGIVIINPATGAPARYYHRYADFLARHGFDAVTYDYRGVGRSAPSTLHGCNYRWRDWGELDFDAVLRLAMARNEGAPLLVVGHSIGGVLPGFSENGRLIDRLLTVGAQFGHWRDYAWPDRAKLLLKWHIAMPALAAVWGYFPGRALGWSEDLPLGVSLDWAFRRNRLELGHPAQERDDLLRRLAAVKAPILAVTLTDDPIATPRAVGRALSYFAGAPKTEVLLSPGDFYQQSIGHFGLFHDRQSSDFWLDSLAWLRDGSNPWPGRPFPKLTEAPPGRTFDIVRYY